jgi:hypothetical protein
VLSTLFVGRQLLLRAYDALSQHLLRDALGAYNSFTWTP